MSAAEGGTPASAAKAPPASADEAPPDAAPRSAEGTQSAASTWPPLPLGEWQPTYETLHMWTQIVGKTRLALAPLQNQWWEVTLYPTWNGLTTGPMPCDHRTVEVTFDFLQHVLDLNASDGRRQTLRLTARSVRDFYADYLEALRALDVHVRIHPVPVEIETAIPFAEDDVHAAYDPDAAQRHWRILLQARRVFEVFRSRFVGKASPVHFFWGSFDLATTRFSGRPAPRHPGGVPNCPNYVMVEAYAQECASAGFWPGGGIMGQPAFYAYAYPEPNGYAQARVEPAAAYYHPDLHEFVLPYEAVREAADPDQDLLAFLQTTYEAAADLGRWDRAALERSGPWPGERR
jgi:hypothetical protein